MFDCLHALFTDVIIEVYEFGMAGVCHAMIADKDDINNICQVSSLQLGVQIPCESVDGDKCILLQRQILSSSGSN